MRRLIGVQPDQEAVLASPMPVGVMSSAADADREFEALFLEHYPRLVKTLLRLVGKSGQAEELAADAFYRLHQHRSQHRSEENLAGLALPDRDESWPRCAAGEFTPVAPRRTVATRG